MDLVMQGCEQRHPPRPARECLAAVWTQGRSCQACWVACYRQGWSHPDVTRDNARLVQQTLRETRLVAPDDVDEEG
jgi:hypothetical protein